MRTRGLLLAACAGALLWPAAADAQALRLTFADALARARERAPRIVSARLSLEEARARVRGANVRQNNPELEFAVGRRAGEVSTSTDVDVGVTQLFEPRGRRAARVEVATEAVSQGSAAIDETTRVVLTETASAFLRALQAAEQMRLLRAAEELATQVHAAAERRFKSGDIAVLDVNIARASLARTRADLRSAAATQAAAVGELKQLLGLDGPVELEGALTPPEPVDVSAFLNSASERPEIRQLEAAIREAEAEARLARSFRQLEFGLSARYEREEGDDVLLGGMTISLPTFARGQELFATSTARSTRLRAELEATRQRVRVEVESAAEAYRLRADAVRVLQEQALPGLDENERLTTRSFEVGQLGLPDLLLIRREILDTRFQYLETLVEAALARVQLQASAAVLR